MTPDLYFVAGGTSGIGRACVEALVRQGHDVIAIGTNQVHAAELRVGVGGHTGAVEVVLGDLTSPEVAARAAQQQAPRPVAGLVNCVGRISRGGIAEESFSGWARTLSANLDAAFNLTKSLLPRLKASGGASIVNVSSVCACQPCESLAYSVSKAGLDMFTKHLARDLAPQKIRVNSVNSGAVRSNLQMSSGIFEDQGTYDEWIARMAALHPLGEGSVDDVSSAILFFLSPAAGWITGTHLAVDGGRATV